jgi:hypothetical protein
MILLRSTNGDLDGKIWERIKVHCVKDDYGDYFKFVGVGADPNPLEIRA